MTTRGHATAACPVRSPPARNESGWRAWFARGPKPPSRPAVPDETSVRREFTWIDESGLPDHRARTADDQHHEFCCALHGIRLPGMRMNPLRAAHRSDPDGWRHGRFLLATAPAGVKKGKRETTVGPRAQGPVRTYVTGKSGVPSAGALRPECGSPSRPGATTRRIVTLLTCRPAVVSRKRFSGSYAGSDTAPRRETAPSRVWSGTGPRRSPPPGSPPCRRSYVNWGSTSVSAMWFT